jgi:hypothetical protein
MPSQKPDQAFQRTKPRICVTHASGREYESRTTPVLCDAFRTDPLMTYYLNKVPVPSRQPTLERLIHLISTAATLNGAEFYEAGTPALDEESAQQFQCAAMFMPPGQAVDNLNLSAWWKLLQQGVLSLIWRTGITAFLKLLVEYPALGERAKETVLSKTEQHYYVLMIGTTTEHRGKGLCSAIIREYQAIAQKDGMPIWLEATTKGSMSVYAKAGFENVAGRWVIGEGKCDASGESANGKEAVGVEIFPMVWWPKGYVKGAEMK